ncbi:copper chaperone PCu(A)C [Streptomyces sp. M2CJ-2]|uniref:copper chaperone PCu(A)C n=1 Tax=Streptomyces sp. M2CJ-2 TaxID=2803948 RepID=UPI001926E3FF|nr:copper chaperone PCu(A)C [Streptomyces sp. M2CJ-2]MBL3667410.1 copper chaperone PCu(A)C [Streptomyces sp. M2CJ-2]
MSSSLRRGAIAAAAIAFSVASLSACTSGNNAQSLQIQPDNAATTVGDIKVQNAIVVTQPDRESTGPAVVAATLFNEGRTDQTLESITLPGTGKTVELTPAKGGSLTVPAGGSLIIGGPGNASAVLPSSREAVQDGNAQPVTFTFSKTGDVSLRAFVHPAESFFSEWGPSEIPAAPGAPAEPSAEASDAPADDASGTPSDSATEGSEASESAGTPSDAASASQSAGD